jgi:hypothetical protein
MARIVENPTIQLAVVFEIGEAEARALDALVGYGDEAFIKVFYEKLGAAYMRDHEAGLRLFFKSIREQMPGVLNRTDKARATFEGRKML